MGTDEGLLGSTLHILSTHEVGSTAIKTVSPPTTISAVENTDQLPLDAGLSPRNATYIRLSATEISPHTKNETRDGIPIRLLAMRGILAAVRFGMERLT
jgi:hypothetical protein